MSGTYQSRGRGRGTIDATAAKAVPRTGRRSPNHTQPDWRAAQAVTYRPAQLETENGIRA
jgi:hypothetical protein